MRILRSYWSASERSNARGSINGTTHPRQIPSVGRGNWEAAVLRPQSRDRNARVALWVGSLREPCRTTADHGGAAPRATGDAIQPRAGGSLCVPEKLAKDPHRVPRSSSRPPADGSFARLASPCVSPPIAATSMGFRDPLRQRRVAGRRSDREWRFPSTFCEGHPNPDRIPRHAAAARLPESFSRRRGSNMSLRAALGDG